MEVHGIKMKKARESQSYLENSFFQLCASAQPLAFFAVKKSAKEGA
jgi:hypothetical protein